MALKPKYNLKTYEADTAAEIATVVFASNELVTALDTGVTKKGNDTDTFADLPAFGGGGGGGDVAWADITGVPAALTTAAAAATPSIRAIGTTATTAAAGNHTHLANAIGALTGLGAGTDTPIVAADTLIAALAKLQAQITALQV